MGRIQNSWSANDTLADLYMPQIEQLGVCLEPYGAAYLGTVDNELAQATVCVYRLGKYGVVTAHRIRMKQDMPFYEHAKTGLCISTLSADSLALCPVVQPHTPKASKNVAVFGQSGKETRTTLLAGSAQNAVSLMVMPEWFKQLEAKHCSTALDLIENVSEIYPDTEASTLDTLLTSIAPPFGGKLANERELFTKAALVTKKTLSWYEELERAEQAAGTLTQARLVRAARRCVIQHLSELLSLEALAHDLYTSRSRLCAAFRQETNESLGAFITRMRMERAEHLLSISSLTIQEIAHAVGYTRISSFTVAFERAHGMSPSAWRKHVVLASYHDTDKRPREDML